MADPSVASWSVRVDRATRTTSNIALYDDPMNTAPWWMPLAAAGIPALVGIAGIIGTVIGHRTTRKVAAENRRNAHENQVTDIAAELINTERKLHYTIRLAMRDLDEKEHEQLTFNEPVTLDADISSEFADTLEEFRLFGVRAMMIFPQQLDKELFRYLTDNNTLTKDFSAYRKYLAHRNPDDRTERPDMDVVKHSQARFLLNVREYRETTRGGKRMSVRDLFDALNDTPPARRWPDRSASHDED